MEQQNKGSSSNDMLGAKKSEDVEMIRSVNNQMKFDS